MTKGGFYGGGTFGFPIGLGGGLYMDSHGRLYPQLYGGTPRFSFSGGYTPDLEGLLTGPSISWSPGGGSIRPNVAGNTDTVGIGIGTPGVGVTHGFGPLEMSNDYSQPWMIPSIRDSAARAGVPSRYNVFEYGYPDSNADSSARDAPASLQRQEASPPTPAFQSDAVYSPMGDFAGNFPGVSAVAAAPSPTAFGAPGSLPQKAGDFNALAQGIARLVADTGQFSRDSLSRPAWAASIAGSLAPSPTAPNWPNADRIGSQSNPTYFPGAKGDLATGASGSTLSSANENLRYLSRKTYSQPQASPTGVDPQNPDLFASPQDEQPGWFYRDDPPWFSPVQH